LNFIGSTLILSKNVVAVSYYLISCRSGPHD